MSTEQAEITLAAMTPFTKPSLRLFLRNLTANARLTKRLSRFYTKVSSYLPSLRPTDTKWLQCQAKFENHRVR